MPKIDLKEAFKDVAAGNSEAQDFCESFYDYCQVLDDLVDRDKPVAQDVVAGVFLRFISTLAFNRFFAEHRERLYAIIHTSVLSWIHSNDRLAKPGLQDRLIGEVLKSEYQGVFFFVAFLTGGWSHQMAMQTKYRDYNFG